MKRLFGTDGIRGRAGHYPTTPEMALALGKALGVLLCRQQKGRHRVVVGKDTRRSCYFFENAILAGLCSVGIDALMVGPLPTPGVAFITTAYRAAAGIMISASHNPFYDNGIKIFNSFGCKLSDALEQELERIIFENDFGPVPEDQEIGSNQRIDDVAGRYIEHVKGSIPKGQNLGGMRIVLDCAHGATYRVAPLVFWELGAQVYVEGDHPNGVNINHQCGALYPTVLRNRVLAEKATVGLAFDGDGDRIQMVDEAGSLVDGDQILAICATHLLKKGQLPYKRVVLTPMSNLGLVRYLESLGIEVCIAKVGDRHVLQMMMDQQAALGGEQSGHLIFRAHSTTGDGIVAGLQVLNIMQDTQKSLRELANCFVKYPQVIRNVPVGQKIPLEQLQQSQGILREIEQLLTGRGRVVLRYSGTENLCRVMVEGEQLEQVSNYCDLLAQSIQDEVDQCVALQHT